MDFVDLMSFLKKLNNLLAKRKKIGKVVWLGLNFAGKTTLIRYLTEGTFHEGTRRTLGLNIDEYESKGLKLICWDVGGQDVFRETLWESYLRGAAGIIYVIDSSDPGRFPESRQELWRWIIENPDIKNVPILFFANKQDLPTAQNAGEIAKALDLDKIGGMSFMIFPCSAASGEN